MDPKPYIKKHRGDQKLPLFDIDKLEGITGCGLYLIPNRDMYAIRQCLPPLEWPTRWKDSDRGGDIDAFIIEVKMSLLPVNCDLGSSPEILEKLQEIVDLLRSSTNQNEGDCDMCKCCCCGNNQTPTLPPVSTPEPTTSNEPVPQNNWCKACEFMVSEYQDSLRQIFVGLVGGGTILSIILAGITGGFFVVGAALLAFIVDISAAAWVGSAMLENIYGDFLAARDDLKCYLFNSTVKTPTGMKASALTWLANHYIDGTPAYLIIYAVISIQKHNRILSTEIDNVQADCTDCGDTGDGEPPVLPENYQIIPANVIFHNVQSGNYGLVHTENANVMTLAYDMTDNGEFCFVNYNLWAGWEDGITGLVGILWFCTSYTRSASPQGVATTKIQNSAMNGDVFANRGVAHLFSSGLPNLVADISTYLVSQGYSVTDNPAYGMDNTHIFGSQSGTEIHGNYPSNSTPLEPPFMTRDKVNSGGQSGRVTMTIEFYYLRLMQ